MQLAVTLTLPSTASKSLGLVTGTGKYMAVARHQDWKRTESDRKVLICAPTNGRPVRIFPFNIFIHFPRYICTRMQTAMPNKVPNSAVLPDISNHSLWGKTGKPDPEFR